MLKAVVVAGIKEVSRAIITQKDESEKTPAERAHGGPCYPLLVEGAGLQAQLDPTPRHISHPYPHPLSAGHTASGGMCPAPSP